MGLPVIAGDTGGIYTFPSVPPAFASFAMVTGSVKTFIHGRSIMLLGQAVTAGGPIASASLFSTKTLVESRPVLLGGAVTFLGTGWVGGVLQSSGAVNVQVS
jgi:hypothetical protein